MIPLEGISANELWFESKCRAKIMRRHRDRLHPSLAAELAELERAGY